MSNKADFFGHPYDEQRSVRWGAQEAIELPVVLGGPPIVTVKKEQFLDFKIEEPRVIRLRLEALADSPVAGLGVIWTVYFGGGSTVIARPITGAVVDPLVTSSPIEIDFSSSTLRVSVVVSNSQGITRQVNVSAFAAPWGYNYGNGGEWPGCNRELQHLNRPAY